MSFTERCSVCGVVALEVRDDGSFNCYACGFRSENLGGVLRYRDCGGCGRGVALDSNGCAVCPFCDWSAHTHSPEPACTHTGVTE